MNCKSCIAYRVEWIHGRKQESCAAGKDCRYGDRTDWNGFWYEVKWILVLTGLVFVALM